MTPRSDPSQRTYLSSSDLLYGVAIPRGQQWGPKPRVRHTQTLKPQTQEPQIQRAEA